MVTANLRVSQHSNPRINNVRDAAGSTSTCVPARHVGADWIYTQTIRHSFMVTG